MKNYNKEIALLMGWVEIPPSKGFWGKFLGQDETSFAFEKDGIKFNVKEERLRFDTDWGWLFTAVMNAISLGSDVKIETKGEDNSCGISFKDMPYIVSEKRFNNSLFDSTYNALGQFAEAYNKKIKNDV